MNLPLPNKFIIVGGHWLVAHQCTADQVSSMLARLGINDVSSATAQLMRGWALSIEGDGSHGHWSHEYSSRLAVREPRSCWYGWRVVTARSLWMEFLT